MKRNPAVEGRFYPSSKESIFNLIHDIEEKGKYTALPSLKKNIYGAVLPHAAHIYSGHQSIPFFRYLIKYNIIPETFIILNPNHHGVGPEIALEQKQTWTNSIGSVEIDSDMNNLLPYAMDSSAQRNEHSAEVIIPFIQYYFQDTNFRILPVCIKRCEAKTMRELAKNLNDVILKTGRNAIILASSDFSHFLSPEKGRKADDLVLKKIFSRKIKAVQRVVLTKGITVCGYGPIMALMSYAELQDIEYHASILARGHSGEVHSSKEVVDYISILFHSKD